MSFANPHQCALFLATLWSERHWTSFDDDLSHMRSLELPTDEVLMEALFGLCKAKVFAH